ncbi:MAG: pyridoxal-dependent decarboxylase [Polyangiaceae bacterium]
MPSYLHAVKQATRQAMVPMVRRVVGDSDDLPIELWGMRVDADGRLRYAAKDVVALAERFGTPLHLLDVNRLDANLAEFLSPPEPKFPGVELYYSFKTQPLPWIIKRLVSRGAAAEVISEYELRLALHLGIEGEKIIYNGPGKSEASIRMAIEAGILALNLNHFEEVERVASVARSVGRRIRVGVRVVTSSGWSSQFGCSIASGEAMATFERALASPELDVIALHSHRGRHIHYPGELAAFVSEVLAFADDLYDRYKFAPKILDFGGSLGMTTVRGFTPVDERLQETLHTPVAFADPSTCLRPSAYVEQLMSSVRAHYRARGETCPRIAIEPGRALTGSAQALVTRVMTIRSSPSELDYAILDGGINIAGILHNQLHQVYRVTNFGAPRDSLYRLVGPICQPGDVLFPCVRLPRLSPGDVLMVMDSGAYFEPDSTSFSFQRPGTLAIEGDRISVIRRAETFEDMIDRDHY